jgi:hypothetical protein
LLFQDKKIQSWSEGLFVKRCLIIYAKWYSIIKLIIQILVYNI